MPSWPKSVKKVVGMGVLLLFLKIRYKSMVLMIFWCRGAYLYMWGRVVLCYLVLFEFMFLRGLVRAFCLVDIGVVRVMFMFVLLVIMVGGGGSGLGLLVGHVRWGGKVYVRRI